MKELLEKLQTKATKIIGRITWATIWREDRTNREASYRRLALGYQQMVTRMWERVGPSGEDAPELNFCFFKNNGTAMFWFRQTQLDKFSHFWVLGEKERKKSIRLYDFTRKESVPYCISDEIIAASAIASTLSEGEEPVTEEEVNEILSRFYATQDFNPTELSFVWVNRLNTMVCNYWTQAPIMSTTMRLVQEKGIEMKVAIDQAYKEVVRTEFPTCLNSNNNDGRYNMSYQGSHFYTIDRHGMAICKEFPNEYLNLAEYDILRGVAATIYRDITLNQDPEDLGISGASWLLEKEPEWTGDNVFPRND